jgi:hypothetical protein
VTGSQSDPWTVHRLRRRWKPTKQRLATADEHEGARIRIHRACSWLQRLEDLQASGVPGSDDTLIFQWIAFNALYGRWDPDRREPISEHDAIDRFVDQIWAVDASNHIRCVLDDHKKLAMALLDNSYLNRYFWKDPSKQRARRTEKAKLNAQSWYVQGDYVLILSALLERIHFLRCQLVHGASTHDGKLNRTAVQHCSTMLGHLMPAFLLVLIDHGYAEDWGPLCYPPVSN